MCNVKTCTKCHVEKPLSEFGKNSKAKDGKYWHCNECMYKLRRTPKRKAQQAVYKSRNTRKRYERSLGLTVQCDLDSHEAAFVLDSGACSYCGIELEFAKATVDHVIPLARGGANTFGNVAGACLCCNQNKADKPALLFMLSECEPYATKKLLERLALRRGVSTEEVYTELVIDAQEFFRQQAGVPAT